MSHDNETRHESPFPQVTDETFGPEVLQSQGPVIVDFWAPWCAPCRSLGAAMEEAAADMPANLKVVKVNVDDNPIAASRYGIRSIPSLLFFRDGEPVGTFTGALPTQAVREVFQRFAAGELA